MNVQYDSLLLDAADMVFMLWRVINALVSPRPLLALLWLWLLFSCVIGCYGT